MSTLRLYQIADDYRSALDALAELEDVPPEAIADTLEGLVGTFQDKAIQVAAYLRTLEAEAAAIENARKAMEQRENALKRHASRLREYLKMQMERAGIPRVKNPWITVRIQANPPSVVIDDDTLLPAHFKQEVTTIKLLKSDLSKALKAGQLVTGARLEKTTRLVIQ
ncbi:MAG: siphovirus Gp157 family protein [Candidatus Competibacteraceae bacterium]|nr:siphovirus Gp157 family protein [Candidatus Competibacteraceae bacterium]